MTGTTQLPVSSLKREVTRFVNGVRYVQGHDFTPRDSSPRDLVWSQGHVELWRYRAPGATRCGPPVVLMLGLVSRSSLFDLYEKASLVRALLEAGFDVYVISWGAADAGDAANTLEVYTHRYLPRALASVLRRSRVDEVTLVGYCMGGNQALLALASCPDLPVRNLVTMATAVDWDKMPSQLDPLRDPRVRPEWFIDGTGCLPGDVIAKFFQIRKPTSGVVQMLSLLERLDDVEYVGAHQAIARWTSDHVPMPRGVAQQVLDQWLRRNGFMTGDLWLDGARVDLKSITCPLLAVLTLRDEVVPPDCARPIVELVGSADAQTLELDAGHLGLVIGRSANKVLHPRLIEWLQSHGERADE